MQNKNKESAFTLIEAMVVLFIVGLLSMTAALGYGQMSRDKAMEQASQRVGQQLSQARDYAVFGKEILKDPSNTNSSFFPCGYGVTFSTGNVSGNDNGSDLSLLYSSDKDRIGTMDSNQSCDEAIINGGATNLAENTVDEADYVSSSTDKLVHLKNVKVESIEDNLGNKTIGCLTVLFSAPRGGSYLGTYPGMYSGDIAKCTSECPPKACNFGVFSESSTALPAYFLINLIISDGSNNSKRVLKVYPSGNMELVSG